MLFTINKKLQDTYNKLLVVGDLHGDFATYKKILSRFNPVTDILIFMGDYADRGSYGVEIIEDLRPWQEQEPENVIMMKGNHELFSQEGKPHFFPCDLVEEAETKRGSWKRFFSDSMCPFIDELYHAVILPGHILFVHGGISSLITDIDSLRNPSDLLVKDLLWSDPGEGAQLEVKNTRRGEGKLFGEKLTKQICHQLNVDRIIRSHQPVIAPEKPNYTHDDRVVTIHSTSAYSGKPYLLEIPIDNPKVLKKVII